MHFQDCEKKESVEKGYMVKCLSVDAKPGPTGQSGGKRPTVLEWVRKKVPGVPSGDDGGETPADTIEDHLFIKHPNGLRERAQIGGDGATSEVIDNDRNLANPSCPAGLGKCGVPCVPKIMVTAGTADPPA
ncbi:unnamed protein product, partial [Amoebophrya sp. A25]|eukprot:GSA25T00022329001.1